MKHTKGPWSTAIIEGKSYEVFISDSIGSMRVDVNSDNNEADLALIAAAPDLLAALESLHSVYMHLLKLDGVTLDDSIAFTARQAIAKAKGES